MLLIIPYDKLSPEVLQGLIEEFATRDGTDYGAREVSLRSKVAQVRRQLEAGKSVILYNTEDSSTAIMMKELVPDEVKSDISDDL
ncbi:MAG: YheU family protein [Gammaproteobacteria bacterium]|nr:YheU family protein [Gammaproteobacteria bacterium]